MLVGTGWRWATMLLGVALWALPAQGRSPPSEWELIDAEDGIQVWRRDVPGTSLVEFRGRGVVKQPIRQIAAVIRNSGREKEWMESCSESFTVRYLTAIHLISYNRTTSPAFFISDRDTVVETNSEVDPNRRAVHVDFHNVEDPRVPEFDGVVRMPKLVGYWDLVQLSLGETEVTYQIQADPGGALPKWIVNWASRDLPLHTIERLREQARQNYDRDRDVLELSLDWTGFFPDPEPVRTAERR